MHLERASELEKHHHVGRVPRRTTTMFAGEQNGGDECGRMWLTGDYNRSEQPSERRDERTGISIWEGCGSIVAKSNAVEGVAVAGDWQTSLL